MKKGRIVGPASDRLSASNTNPGRSKTRPAPCPRTIAIRNAHPRLHIPRAAVAQAFALLDAHFKILPADLAHLSLPRPRLHALKSQISNFKSQPATSPLSLPLPPLLKSSIENQKSKIPSVLPPGELSLVFLTDPALARIHADFMADPTATDVITFEGDPLAELAGEICISADTAARYVGLAEGPRPCGPPGSHPRSRLAGTRALQDQFAAELTLYLVHGWLHLTGYDDLESAKRRRMRAAESRAMKLLQTAGAIPPFRLA